MPLTMANAGETNTIRKIVGQDEAKQHLANLGFVLGENITVIAKIGGNMILAIKESRIALDITMTNRIMVQEKKNDYTKRCENRPKSSSKKLNGQGPLKRRIMDMGVTKGVEIYVRKVAPLGDPIEVTLRGYELSLRKNDAEMIEVE